MKKGDYCYKNINWYEKIISVKGWDVNMSENNLENGVYLVHNSSYNSITHNTLSNNGLYCVCYEETCLYNTFENDGCEPVNLDLPPYDPGGNLDYLYSVLFIILFIGSISGLSIYGMSKRKKMRESGYKIDQNESRTYN